MTGSAMVGYDTNRAAGRSLKDTTNATTRAGRGHPPGRLPLAFAGPDPDGHDRLVGRRVALGDRAADEDSGAELPGHQHHRHLRDRGPLRRGDRLLPVPDRPLPRGAGAGPASRRGAGGGDPPGRRGLGRQRGDGDPGARDALVLDVREDSIHWTGHRPGAGGGAGRGAHARAGAPALAARAGVLAVPAAAPRRRARPRGREPGGDPVVRFLVQGLGLGRPPSGLDPGGEPRGARAVRRGGGLDPAELRPPGRPRPRAAGDRRFAGVPEILLGRRPRPVHDPDPPPDAQLPLGRGAEGDRAVCQDPGRDPQRRGGPRRVAAGGDADPPGRVRPPRPDPGLPWVRDRPLRQLRLGPPEVARGRGPHHPRGRGVQNQPVRAGEPEHAGEGAAGHPRGHPARRAAGPGPSPPTSGTPGPRSWSTTSRR